MAQLFLALVDRLSKVAVFRQDDRLARSDKAEQEQTGHDQHMVEVRSPGLRRNHHATTKEREDRQEQRESSDAGELMGAVAVDSRGVCDRGNRAEQECSTPANVDDAAGVVVARR